jgi:hypothetical protein
LIGFHIILLFCVYAWFPRSEFNFFARIMRLFSSGIANEPASVIQGNLKTFQESQQLFYPQEFTVAFSWNVFDAASPTASRDGAFQPEAENENIGRGERLFHGMTSVLNYLTPFKYLSKRINRGF